MAVQLPNFLNAALINPDYSGLSDIFQNYYGGKALKQQDIIGQNQAKAAPLDLLMKQIQAEFARPNAETALAGSKLGNQSTGLSNQHMLLQINQLKKQLAEQAAIENQIKAAMGGQQASMPTGGQGGGMQGGGGFGGVGGGQPQPDMQDSAQSQGMYQPVKMRDMNESLSNVMQNPMMKNQPTPTSNPLMEQHPEGMQKIQTRSNERFQELEPGSAALYGIDHLWDTNPMARPLIEKRYGKKEVKREYDKASGTTRLVTTWPSQRVTVKTIMPMQEEASGEIPLTKPVLNKAVMQVRGTDAVIPYIDQLINMATPKKVKSTGGVIKETELPYFYWHPTNAGANYEGIMNEAADKYLTATGLNVTDQSIQTVKHILQRGIGESDKNYLKRLTDLKKAKIKEREQNVRMIDKGIKKYGNAEMNAPASEMSDDQLKAAYYGE